MLTQIMNLKAFHSVNEQPVKVMPMVLKIFSARLELRKSSVRLLPPLIKFRLAPWSLWRKGK